MIHSKKVYFKEIFRLKFIFQNQNIEMSKFKLRIDFGRSMIWDMGDLEFFVDFTKELFTSLNQMKFSSFIQPSNALQLQKDFKRVEK